MQWHGTGDEQQQHSSKESTAARKAQEQGSSSKTAARTGSKPIMGACSARKRKEGDCGKWGPPTCCTLPAPECCDTPH